MVEPLLLLVEDNADDAALAQRALARSGLRASLRIVRSSNEAWTLLNNPPLSQRPRAIFLDLNMPEWSGFELLEKVRTSETMKRLPVVILTTSQEPEDIERSYRLGANSFVTKPVDFRKFSEVFASMLTYWVSINETV